MSQTATTTATVQQPSSHWRDYWSKVFHLDRGQMDAFVALRNATGVLLPLAAGTAMGMPLGGLAVATGALQVSFSDSPGPYPQRARRMLTASVLCALALVAGGLAMRSPYLAGMLVAVWAFAAGLVVCLGTTAENLGVISLVTLIIYAVQPLTVERAMASGLLALGGGLFQTLLALALWPVRRYYPERRALADFYRELARAAVTPAVGDSPPASIESTQARESLAALGNDNSLEAERYWSLLNQAERIRLGLLTLRRLRKRMQRQGDDSSGFQLTEEFLTTASEILSSIAHALPQAQRAVEAERRLPDLEGVATRVRELESPTSLPLVAALNRDAVFQMDALTGQIRSAIRTVGETTPAELAAFASHDAMQPWRRRFAGSLARLRANLTLQSSAFRHAVRLAVCITVGGFLAHQTHNRRSYWLAMTIVIVLKQEFASTISRGVLRVLGTILGLLLATAIFHFLPAGIVWKILLVGLMVFLVRWAGPANYGVFTIAISALVVVLLALNGVSPKDVMFVRFEMTLLGGLLALATYLLWPTWEHVRIPLRLANMLESYRLYFNAVAAAHLQDNAPDEATLARLRMTARLARSNLEAAAGRLRVEPGSTNAQIDLLQSVLANTHRFARAMMAIETIPPTEEPARPGFAQFTRDVDKTLSILIAALRGQPANLRRMPNLREDHRLLVHSSASSVERYALANQETDRMTNTLNTLADQVRLWQSL